MDLLIRLHHDGTRADVLAADDEPGAHGHLVAPGQAYLGIPYDTWHQCLGTTASLRQLRGQPAPGAAAAPGPDVAVGDVLDTAFQLIRRGSILPLGVAVLLFLPPMLLAPAPVGTPRNPVVILWLILTTVWMAMAQVVLIHLLSQAYHGYRPQLRETIAAVAGRFETVLGVTVVAGVLIMLGTMAFVLPGIFLMCRFYVVYAVAVLEDTRTWPALGRSSSLVEGAGWKVLGAVLTVMVLNYLVRYGVGGLYRLGGPLAAIAVPVNVVASAFLALLTAAVVTSFYYALRVTREGYDLEQLAAGLEDEEEPALASA